MREQEAEVPLPSRCAPDQHWTTRIPFEDRLLDAGLVASELLSSTRARVLGTPAEAPKGQFLPNLSGTRTARTRHL